jgi:hypothetical protein
MPPSPPAEHPSDGATRLRRAYLVALAWAFALFNSVRVASYLPTMWAIWQSGDSSQHSLITWVTWLGANATMSAWLFEANGGRIDRAVVVSAVNAAMCLGCAALITYLRL